MNGDEVRWADAHALRRPPPSDAEFTRLRRQLRLSWCIVGVLLVGALAAVLLTIGDRHGRTIAVRAILGAGLLVGLVGILIGLVGAAVSDRTSSFDSPVSALARPQRRLLLQEVRGRVPADPAHLELARSLAYRLSLPGPALPFSFGGLVFLVAAGSPGHPRGARIVLLAAATDFVLGLLTFGVVQARRAPLPHRAHHPSRRLGR